MKQVTFLLLLLLSVKLNAQDTTVLIDFKKIKTKYKITIPTNNSIQIRLINLNRKIYKIQDEITSEDYNTTLPESLKGLKIPAFIFNKPSQIPSAAATSYLPTGTFKFEEIDNKLKSLLFSIQSNGSRINNAIDLFNEIKHISNECTDSTSTTIEKINNVVKKYLYNSELNSYSPSYLYQSLKDTLIIQLKYSEQSLKTLKELIDNYSSKSTEIIITELSATKSNLFDINQKLVKEKNKKERNKIELERDSITKIFDSLNVIEKETKESIDMHQSLLKQAEELVDQITQLFREDKIYAIYSSYRVLVNKSNYEYNSTILTPTKDETKLSLTITSEELNECDFPSKKTTEIEIRTTGGIKIDFSTGIFFNIGSNDFLGNTYYYKKTSSDTREIKTAERNNQLMLSIGSLMHIYKRSPAKVKLAGSVGVSTTAGLENLNFHIGPSLIIGNKNRFIINSGLTLKSAPMLDKQLKTGVIYKIEETPDEIPTIQVFPKAGWYIGFTYNVTMFK